MTPFLSQTAGLFTQGALAAAGAAAVAVPIAIHLLTRLRRRERVWAAMRFLQEAFRQQRRRLQLEQLLLLLVRCLILIMLGLALAGPLLGGIASKLGLDTSGRLLVLVIDDSLSAAASPDGQKPRFDTLRAQAVEAINSLRPGDRVALWTAGRPVKARLLPPSMDRAEAVRAVESLQPRAVRADWPAALSDARRFLDEQNADPERTYLLMLGDFSAGSADIARALPADLSSVGRRARVLVARPMPDTPNVQISGLTPRRFVVLPERGGVANVSLEIKLRRFGGATNDGVGALDIAAIADDPAKPVASVRREVRWSAGQTLASVNVELPLPSNAAAAGGRLAIRARLEPGIGAGLVDTLAADNLRWSVVERRDRMTVAVADEPVLPRAADAPVVYRPRDWIGFALDPRPRAVRDANPAWFIQPAPVTAATLDAKALAGAEAAIVLRPDLLGAPGWDALADLADRGGVVWLFQPPLDTPAIWTAHLRDKLNLPWRVNLEPRRQSASSAPADAAAPVNNAQPPAWLLRLDTPVPEPLRLIAGDWAPLLRPVRVTRRLDVNTAGPAETSWLRVVDDDPKAGDALLAVAPRGDGHVLLTAAALDLDWTNLPRNPLFIPLVHETLRGLLGSSAEAVRMNTLVCGEAPSLGRKWEGADEAVRLTDGNRVVLKRTDRGLEPATPLDEPGVYSARPTAIAQRFAINPDADAGDTASLAPEALGQWLNTLGNWRWLDADKPALDTAEPARANLGWPLLWITLLLVLLETFLAKKFSHANTGA